MISADDVRAIHDRILRTEEGLSGEPRVGALEGALGRIDNRLEYSQEEMDVFAVAALYAVAIAKAHAFSDGNKRTALVTALIFLEQVGNPISKCEALEDAMVDVAEGTTDERGFAVLLSSIWQEEMARTGDDISPSSPTAN